MTFIPADSWFLLAVAVLAAFWAYETLVLLSPWEINPLITPWLMLGLAAGAMYLPFEISVALAAAGVVGLLHLGVRSATTGAFTISRPTTSSLPGGASRRIPELP
jgi:hypothetical protein